MLRVAGFIYMKNNQISCSCQRLAHKTQAFHRDLLPCVGSHNFGKRKLNCCTCGYYRSRFSGKKPGLLAHIKHFKHLSPVSKALHWPPLNSRLFTGLYILGLIHPSFDNLFPACLTWFEICWNRISVVHNMYLKTENVALGLVLLNTFLFWTSFPHDEARPWQLFWYSRTFWQRLIVSAYSSVYRSKFPNAIVGVATRNI